MITVGNLIEKLNDIVSKHGRDANDLEIAIPIEDANVIDGLRYVRIDDLCPNVDWSEDRVYLDLEENVQLTRESIVNRMKCGLRDYGPMTYQCLSCSECDGIDEDSKFYPCFKCNLLRRNVGGNEVKYHKCEYFRKISDDNR